MTPKQIFWVAIAALALLAVSLFARKWYRVKWGWELFGVFKGWFKGTATPERLRPGVRLQDATSKKGGINVRDGTAKGADVKRVTAHGDINVSSDSPGDPDPKA